MIEKYLDRIMEMVLVIIPFFIGWILGRISSKTISKDKPLFKVETDSPESKPNPGYTTGGTTK